jgi:transposase-like protein
MVRAKAENGRRQVSESRARTRRRWPESQKLQIVRESHRPGAVLFEIARENGLHPSLLTKWRAQHRDGMLGTVSDAGGAARLLPVQVSTGSMPSGLVRSTSPVESAARLGAIEVEFSSGRRLYIQGVVDAGMLCTVLQELSRS